MNTSQTRLGALQIGILLLTAATAIIHIILAIPDTMLMFYLNGFGYLALAAALYLPQFSQYRKLVRWILIGFTLITILGWVAIGVRSPVAYLDKIIEVGLVALLWIEGRQK